LGRVVDEDVEVGAVFEGGGGEAVVFLNRPLKLLTKNSRLLKEYQPLPYIKIQFLILY